MAKRKKWKNFQREIPLTIEEKIARQAADFARRHKCDSHESELRRQQSDATSKEKAIPSLISNLHRRTHPELLRMFQNCLDRMENRFRKPPKSVQALHGAIIEEWARRYDSLKSGKMEFDWPSSEPSPGENFSIGSTPQIGMLVTLGYRVGYVNGVSEARRRLILDQVFSIELPPINSFAYMAAWGRPKTNQRLEKLAHTLAAMTRINGQSRSFNYERAIRERRDDLEYIKAKYYNGYFGFPWPTIN